MVNSILAANQIKGLVPALDPRNLTSAALLNGTRNVMIDFKGPYAAFASRIFTYNKFYTPLETQSFRITNNDEIIFMQGAAFQFDWMSQRLYCVYTFTDPDQIWPWTCAVVDSIFYFAKKGLNGILRFDPSLNSWSTVTNNVPSSPLAVTQAAGRLVIMSNDLIAWSALGDGTNLTPDLNSGAGFQSLKLIGGNALGVKEVVDGFLTFTDKGTLKSEITTGNNPFRHYALDRTYSPLNQFCIVELETREILIFDRRGLFVTLGQQYQDFEPLMSEYLRHTLLPSLDLTNKQVFKLYYDANNEVVYLSVQTGPIAGLYDYAHVYSRPRGEWGIFNALHYTLMELANLQGPQKGYNLGYLGDDLYFHAFVPDVFNEIAPTGDAQYFYRSEFERPVREIEGMITFSSNLHINSLDEKSTFQTSGMYDVSGSTVSPYLGVSNALNSIARIGLFRFSDSRFPDELNIVTNVKLAVDNLPGNPVIEDWNNQATTITEDWNNWPGVDTFEDWGLNILSATLFDVVIYGTNDGENTFEDQEETMTLNFDEGDDKHYGCFNTGIYHILELHALDVNKTFHLRLIEISGSVGGRL